MAIEIKELHIKVSISERPAGEKDTKGLDRQAVSALRSQIIEECIEKVIEKLKEREER